jgi:hypothetical protein
MSRLYIPAGILFLFAQLLSAMPQAHSGREAPKGELTRGVYRNATFGLTYKPPFGWVDRTADMNESDGQEKSSSNSQVLLAMFERPPEAKGSTINSAVVIAAESASSFPGLKKASDYFGPLEDAATAKGFKVVNEPYRSSVGTRQVARADFSKPFGSLTMQQTSLVIMEKGYVVSFTFIGASDDEIDDLVGRLSFAGPAAHQH